MTTQTEALKMALKALEEIYVGNMTPMAEANWNKAITAIKEALAQPEQEPVAWAHKGCLESIKDFDATIYANGGFDDAVALYTNPPQRKPQFKEFIKWANAQGYDCAHTCNSNTGEWIVLNPMTACLWKAWQAAHSIEE